MLPRGAVPVAPTLAFRAVTSPVSLLATIDAAVRASPGADTDLDHARCTLRVCAWTAEPGTGTADAARFSVSLYAHATDAGVLRGTVYLAVFRRCAGSEVLFWRVLRRALEHLVFTSTCGPGGASFTVAPASHWGAEVNSWRAAAPAPPHPLTEEDVIPVTAIVRTPQEDMREQGCKMAAALAVVARNTPAGMAACISTGCVAAIVGTIGARGSVECRTAATTALAEWVSTNIGLDAVRCAADECAVSAARAALVAVVDVDEAATDFTARHLQRESARALHRLGRA